MKCDIPYLFSRLQCAIRIDYIYDCNYIIIIRELIEYLLYLDSLLGILIQCLPLGLKDLCIGFQEVLSFHALSTRHGTHQDGYVNVLEGH